MPRGILLVFSNPSSPDRLAEFNEWYSGTHLPEFLRLSNITSARRFQLSSSQMPQPPGIPVGGRQFLAAYEIETDDFAKLRDEIMATGRDRTHSDVLELDPLPVTMIFEQLGDTQTEALPLAETSPREGTVG
jgi:hypothetical protein